jgi:hypothetical protein
MDRESHKDQLDKLVKKEKRVLDNRGGPPKSSRVEI